MAADDFLESEVAIAAAATAALLSPRVREVARRGAVYGVVGVLTAGRAVVGVAREAGRGVGSVMPSGGSSRSAGASSSSRSRAASTTRRSPRSGAARSKPTTRSAGSRRGTRGTGNAASSGSGSGSPAASASS